VATYTRAIKAPLVMSEKGKLIIACGDPAGVGPELIEAWLAANEAQSSHVSVVGPEIWLQQLQGEGERISVGDRNFKAKPGEPSVTGAKLAIDALQVAAAACRDGQADAVITAPASKLWMQRAGFTHPGHTEYFAEEWGGDPSMAFAGGKLRIVLATWHIPLMKVREALCDEVIERAIRSAHYLAVKFGADEPRIAVCGLNPHAGEDGLLGDDEKVFIDPLLDRLRSQYPGLSGTQPADTVFHRHLKDEFDVVVALYHDQGLAPLKTLEFEQSVNLTLGLPWIRTSPDHGTAFEIAGKGVATIHSFDNAVRLAAQLAGNR